MENNGDEVCYSTVNIKNSKPSPTDTEEDSTVYSEVKQKKAAPAQTSQEKEETAALCDSRLILVCLGILCVLLVVSIAVIVYMSMKMTMQQTEINNLIKENERVTEENKIMQNKNKELSRERDDLNKTLGFILKFDNFPVKDYCSDEGCEPCRTDWILFQEKCYLFYDKPSPWKSWTQSRTFCQDKHADLVVIDDLEEQKFVSNHTKYYYDIHHGYWMGLQHVNNTWTWVDGHADTLGFWVKEHLRTSGPKVLLVPERKLTESWGKADDGFANKFICEGEALFGFK
uniref:C-type lectin domain-containing protein n=1 Tax=Poecilia mexicana TaxID=48701 RepID=A0A3B3Y481_9TELE